jgi:2-polyprenyl-3-methyl-5-hydroxy-6-metoxy-1,4-benzoquinol methylase
VGFHHARKRQMKYYESLKRLDARHREVVGDVRDKQVLDYGCGVGVYSLDLLQRGARVHAIDISPVLISKLQDAALERGLADRLKAQVMNAEALEYPDDTFDRVVGNGILHHLDIERACREVARVLKPNGKAVFIEPLGINPMINLYRRLTPGARTVDERPFTRADLATIRRIFPQSQFQYYGLVTLGNLALLGLGLKGMAQALRSPMETLDDWVLNRLGLMQPMAWQTLMTMKT